MSIFQNMNVNKFEKIILSYIKPHADPKRKENDKNYMGSNFELIGCSMPIIRSAYTKSMKEINNLSHLEKVELLDSLWKSSKYFAILYISLFYFDNLRGKTDLSDWKILQSWSKKIDNWGHSDVLSGIYADLFERYPKDIYSMLKKWNKSKNSWEKRLSLTSLLYYSRMRKKPASYRKILPLVKNLLDDENIYVQKAVGWTLRECGNLYPEETKKFIKNHILQISSIAFSSSTEKWSKQEKEPLKTQRKNHRQKKA